MTAGVPNMVYIVGQRKNPEKPIPVLPKERIREAQAPADRLRGRSNDL